MKNSAWEKSERLENVPKEKPETNQYKLEQQIICFSKLSPATINYTHAKFSIDK